MNILIISQYYYPEPFLISEIAEQLALHHNVTVLTGLPNYPSGVIDREYRHGKRRKEIIGGVKIIRCGLIGKTDSKIRIMANYLSFMLTASAKVMTLKEKFDVVFVYQLSPVLMAVPALLYKALHKKKVYLYCLDAFPAAIETHISAESFLYRCVHRISKAIYGWCDRIGVTSPFFTEYLVEENNVSEEKITYIPQHANGEMLALNLEKVPNGKTEFMFAGNMGHEQSLDTVVLAADFLAKRKCSFKIHFVGDGSCEESLKKMVTQKGLNEFVDFHGRQERKKMPLYYKLADALLLTLSGSASSGNTIPGKLQTYMTTGKPIFAAINGTSADIIAESHCGECVGAGEAEALADLMEKYMRNPYLYKACGQNGKRYFADHFTLEKHIDCTLHELEKCANNAFK